MTFYTFEAVSIYISGDSLKKTRIFCASFQWWSTTAKNWAIAAKRVSHYKRTLIAVGVKQRQSVKSLINVQVTKQAGSIDFKHAHKCYTCQRERLNTTQRTIDQLTNLKREKYLKIL